MTGIADAPSGVLEANKALLRRLTGIIVEGNLDDLAGHPGYYETRQRIPALRSGFPDLKVTIEKQVAEGNLVCTHAWFEGTHTGEWLGIAATGKRVRFQNVSIDEVADGRVVQHNAESGWLSLLMALGVLPFPSG
ncbi:MAG TPA: ester cyclase [Actinomycetota bacterium]|nr:ester cyclase [Actinomycetota bacterium]